jgi:hypothetical protein
MGFQVFCRTGEKKGPTLEVECKGDPPYGDRQRHNSFISVPNRNASRTKLLKKMPLCGIVDEDLRAKNDQ